MAIKRDTNTILYNEVLKLVKENGHYDKAAQILDYSLAESYKVRELTNYEFDFIAKVNWGGSEGIYIDCYLEGDFDSSQDKRLHVGTLKTLDTSIEAFKIMGELSGALTYYCHIYVNSNLDRYNIEKA